ncbi:hypothetical protein AX16_002958 [Volvariella volvacea WC 439]|uniref:Cell division cycle 42 protein n=1 Tax=Volvariella volvacea TaxID=36659 RepID=R9WYS5_9AGAR|nr:cell division cycle 42 protein [Volvariella volvacea]AOC97480.1 Rho family protein [Volvariella volvacea]KAF8655875.1 hypothetical protein AX16_002958 [Volvariella volvacea WC 439]
MQVAFALNKYPEPEEVMHWTGQCRSYEVAGRTYQLALYDTSGSADYTRIRPIVYQVADVIVYCFKLNSSASLERVRGHWVPEVRQYCPEVCSVLVGTHADLRDRHETDSDTLIPSEDGEQLMKEVEARAYIECSSRTLKGLSNVFYQVVGLPLRS